MAVEDEGTFGSLAPVMLHVFREAAGWEVAAPRGVRPFPDAPNVHGLSFTVRDAIDGPVAELALDIIHRSLGVAPVAGAPADLPPGLVAGVLTHVVERILAGDALDGGRFSDGQGISVGRLFELASEAGLGVRVVRGSGEMADLGLPPDARAVLERSMADGWIAVAPARAIASGGIDRAGWWLVDPATGRTVDQLDDGRGEETFSYAQHIDQNVVVLTKMHLQNKARIEALEALVAQQQAKTVCRAIGVSGIAAGGAIKRALEATGNGDSVLGLGVAAYAGFGGALVLGSCL
jgi:hypothetical protein